MVMGSGAVSDRTVRSQLWRSWRWAKGVCACLCPRRVNGEPPVVEDVGGGRPSRWADELVWSSSWRIMVTTG